jgi:hypothetical protein
MSYAGFTQSNVPGILKELYDDQKVQWLTYKDNPALAMIHKEEKFPGKYFPNPVVYSLSSGGASATFANAYANQSSPLVAEFLVTRVSDFSLATIDGQLLAAAQTDPGAFIDGSELMIDAAFQVAVNRVSQALFRDGTGRIGESSGTITGTTPNYILTFNNPDDATNFEINQVLVGCASTNMVTLISANSLTTTNAPIVQAVDRNAGTITLASGDASLPTDWPSGTYLAVQGDTPTTSNNNFQPTGSTNTNSLLKLSGFPAWLTPAGGTPNTSFFGVNCALDPQRLSGVSFDGSALSLEEALLQGTGRIAMQGGRVDTGITSYATYTALITSLGSKVQYIDEKIGEIGFRGVQVNGANTVMSVFPDRSCYDGVIFALEMDSWVLRSQNPAPHILKYMDEIEILRVPGVDAAELRVGGYMNSYTKKPGHNGQIKVQLQEF